VRTIVDASPAAHFNAAGGITLRIAARERDGGEYPSSTIPKGLTMSFGGVELSEEGVGFGVPVLKQPRETIFPGNLRIRTGPSVAVAEYEMNLVERLSLRTRRSLPSMVLNALREPLAFLHRRLPVLRGPLTGFSNVMRAAFGIRTTFEHAPSRGIIRVTYRYDAEAEKVGVRMEAHDLAAEGCIELIIMNELGARFFDRYTDSAGCEKRGSAIETWQETTAAHASFHDSRHGVSFTVDSVPGARLFRGRELIEGRLAWAGLAYVLPPETKEFCYDIAIGVPG
jgi:hypothetical protein